MRLTGLRDQRSDGATSHRQGYDGEAPLSRARAAEGGFRALQEGVAGIPFRQLRRRRKGSWVVDSPVVAVGGIVGAVVVLVVILVDTAVA